MPDFDPAQLTDEQIAAVMTEAGRRAAARRKRDDRVCRACGTVIPEALTTRRYCSEACRQRARYWRVKDPETDPTAPFRTTLQGNGWEDARTYTRRKKQQKRA